MKRPRLCFDTDRQLDDLIQFGKWAGQTLRTVIERDPSYVQWALREVNNFYISEEAQQLLDEALSKQVADKVDGLNRSLRLGGWGDDSKHWD